MVDRRHEPVHHEIDGDLFGAGAGGQELRIVEGLDLAIETHALEAPLPLLQAVSRFPHVRRDLAITVPVATPLSAITNHASVAAGELLTDLRVFDIYQGAGIEPTRKSVALGLIFQDKNKTLTDSDADALMAAVAAELGKKLDARVRS